MSVGHSDRRTPVKHEYLNKQVGAEIGAAEHCARKLRVPYRRHCFVDLTAGDGIAYHGEGDWRRACSPGIFAHHARWQGARVDVEVLLCERAPAVFEQLVSQLSIQLPALGYKQSSDMTWQVDEGRVLLTAFHGDSRELPCSWSKGDFVYLNNDPNKVHDWALPTRLPEATSRGAIIRSFTTMGCNAGGLKRLPYEGGRDTWYGHIQGVIATLRPTQDLTLLAIDGDDAQWAYLAITPAKWITDAVVEAHKVFRKHDMTVTAVSLRNEPKQSSDLQDRLFLTVKERSRRDDRLW